jgi:hypothetical protein
MENPSELIKKISDRNVWKQICNYAKPIYLYKIKFVSKFDIADNDKYASKDLEQYMKKVKELILDINDLHPSCRGIWMEYMDGFNMRVDMVEPVDIVNRTNISFTGKKTIPHLKAECDGTTFYTPFTSIIRLETTPFKPMELSGFLSYLDINDEISLLKKRYPLLQFSIGSISIE